MFGIAIVANDNLQDLKTGQLVGSTPWKQQVALIIGVIAGALVLPPVLQLLATSFGFAGAPGAGPNALAAPQASLFAAIAQGVLGGDAALGSRSACGAGIGLAIVVARYASCVGRAASRCRRWPWRWASTCRSRWSCRR